MRLWKLVQGVWEVILNSGKPQIKFSDCKSKSNPPYWMELLIRVSFAEILTNWSCSSLVLLLLLQFFKTGSTCWIGSVGAEGDSGCEVDAASEHLSRTVRRVARCRQSMVIRSVLAVTRPPRGHPPPSAPTSPSHLHKNFQPTRERETQEPSVFDGGAEQGGVLRFFLIVSRLGYILPCCRRDSGEAGERLAPNRSCLA